MNAVPFDDDARVSERRWLPIPLLLAALPISLIVLVCFASSLLPLPLPNEQDLLNRLKPPVWLGGTWAHALGTDQLGRDMLARILAGGKLTLLIAGTGVAIGGVVGTIIGMIAGFRGGLIDTVLMRIIDAQLSLPIILLAMTITATRQPSVATLIIVLATISWAPYSRVIRSETLSLRERPFVHALTGLGMAQPRILLRHIFPNVVSTFTVMATIEIAVSVLAESALSFLGLGVQPPDVSWGMMLAQGRSFMKTAWWTVVFPGLAITLVVLAVNVLGEALRARFDPREAIE
jgi:peptide/nickel transport system permease protein